MKMTEEFSRVNDCFLEASNRALMAGRWPTKVLFGPEELEAWENMKKSHDMTIPGFVTLFEGLPVGHMEHPGVAVITKALPVIKLGIYKNGFPPS